MQKRNARGRPPKNRVGSFIRLDHDIMQLLAAIPQGKRTDRVNEILRRELTGETLKSVQHLVEAIGFLDSWYKASLKKIAEKVGADALMMAERLVEEEEARAWSEGFSKAVSDLRQLRISDKRKFDQVLPIFVEVFGQSIISAAYSPRVEIIEKE